MTRKRSSDQSVISVVDKEEDMGDDSFFEGSALETDNISNIIRSQAGIDVSALSGGTFFEKEDEEDDSENNKKQEPNKEKNTNKDKDNDADDGKEKNKNKDNDNDNEQKTKRKKLINYCKS